MLGAALPKVDLIMAIFRITTFSTFSNPLIIIMVLSSYPIIAFIGFKCLKFSWNNCHIEDPHIEFH